jgi:hypothetical protein
VVEALPELPLEVLEPLLEVLKPLLEVLTPLLLELAALSACEPPPPQPLSALKANIDVASSHTQEPRPLVSTSIIVYFDSFTGGVA